MGNKKSSKYDEAFLLYEKGLSLSEVGKALNVSRQSVFEAFKKRGFQLREVKPAPYQEYDGKKFTLKRTGYYTMTIKPRTLMHRYVWENEVGPIPQGWDIHHINEVKSDNRLENLECLPKAEHTRKYSPHNNQYTRGRRRDSYRTV